MYADPGADIRVNDRGVMQLIREAFVGIPEILDTPEFKFELQQAMQNLLGFVNLKKVENAALLKVCGEEPSIRDFQF